MFSALDHHYMAAALRAARAVRHLTRANPRVGAVLVRDGQVLAVGATQPPGQAHAEVMALKAAGDARGATLYVTLEPCNHQGRTPPCVDAIIQAGIARVVCAAIDPNPRVNAAGIERLKAAGIRVETGLMASQSEALNPGFMRRMQAGLPWVTLKLACSLDGATAMADGQSKWITGPLARREVQRMRARSGAIVTGIGTLLADDPGMNVRWDESGLSPGPLAANDQPLRVVMDRSARTPVNSRWMTTPGRKLIAYTQSAGEDLEVLSRHGAELWQCPSLGPKALLQQLSDIEINEVLVEAGPTLAGAWMNSGCVDRLVLFQAPLLMGSQTQPLMHTPTLTSLADAWRLRLLSQRTIGVDQCFEYSVEPYGSE